MLPFLFAIVEVISTQNRLHFALTCPHIIIYCGDDDTTCFCKKPPMEMCGKIVQHTFHVPENAPKLTRKVLILFIVLNIPNSFMPP